MPIVIRCWLGFSRMFGFALRFWAKRMHRQQGISFDRFTERLGVPSASRGPGRWIWIHAASLGEVSQTGQLIAEVQETYGINVVVTTVTQSGAKWVEQTLPNVAHQFLPLDTRNAVSGFLDSWAPDLAIFVEADIWPRLVLEAAARRIPLALLNARPSKSRERAPKSFQYLLSHFAAITCKSTQVLEGLRKLGIASERLHFFGDLRATVPALPIDPAAVVSLQTAIGDRLVWIAASSHGDDEAQIIAACKQVLDTHPQSLLIWAPRHPERGQNILEASSGLLVHSRSKSEAITEQTQIYLADTFGELGTLFSCGKIVFLGGSFGTEGGHNPYEPARSGCYTITGPNITNHKNAFADFMRVGAAEIVSDGAELGQRVSQILASGTVATDGEKARVLVAGADGAVTKIAALLVAQMDG